MVQGKGMLFYAPWPRRSGPGQSSGPQPPPSPPPAHSPTEEVDVEERKKTASPESSFKVIFHNDDYTTMDYVIEVLQRLFHWNEDQALHIIS